MKKPAGFIECVLKKKVGVKFYACMFTVYEHHIPILAGPNLTWDRVYAEMYLREKIKLIPKIRGNRYSGLIIHDFKMFVESDEWLREHNYMYEGSGLMALEGMGRKLDRMEKSLPKQVEV